MICYKDRTFCPFYKTCKSGNDCERALTDQIIAEAVRFDMLISRFSEKPECYIEIDNGD